MRKLIAIVAVIAALAPVMAVAAGEGVQWAYPVSPPKGTVNREDLPPAGKINDDLVRNSYTGLPDAPDFIAIGKPQPCAICHTASGNGHPMTADISGLPANYLIEQVHAFANGQRVDKRTGRMVAEAKAISESDLKAVAAYYAAVSPKHQRWMKTVIGAQAPNHEYFAGPGGTAYAIPGANEPIPVNQIVVMPQDEDMVRADDQLRGGYVQYVRPEEMAQGQKVVETGDGGRLIKCAACHGADLKGQGDVPRLAGRLPTYLIRAMNDMRDGANKNPKAAVMASVAVKMTDEDIVGAAVYLASKAP